MASNRKIDIEIDKLTRSIENAITGDSFQTEVLKISSSDLKLLKKSDWVFDWQKESRSNNKIVYKLVIRDNPKIIQGLIKPTG